MELNCFCDSSGDGENSYTYRSQYRFVFRWEQVEVCFVGVERIRKSNCWELCSGDSIKSRSLGNEKCRRHGGVAIIIFLEKKNRIIPLVHKEFKDIILHINLPISVLFSISVLWYSGHISLIQLSQFGLKLNQNPHTHLRGYSPQ